jgi:hypothetical protein
MCPSLPETESRQLKERVEAVDALGTLRSLEKSASIPAALATLSCCASTQAPDS